MDPFGGQKPAGTGADPFGGSGRTTGMDPFGGANPSDEPPLPKQHAVQDSIATSLQQMEHFTKSKKWILGMGDITQG